MKSLTKTVMLFGLLLCMAGAKAQSSQAPHLFDAFPNTISCNIIELERIFSIPEGTNVQIVLSTNFIYRGSILNSIQRYSNLKSVLIKSSNFDAAMFSISRRVNDDNTITYVGRILNKNYADGYELIKQGNSFILNKIELKEILQDR